MLPDKILYKVSLKKNLENTETRRKFPAGRLLRLAKKDFCRGKFVLEGGGFGIMETRNLAANFYGLSLFLARVFSFSKDTITGKYISRADVIFVNSITGSPSVDCIPLRHTF